MSRDALRRLREIRDKEREVQRLRAERDELIRRACQRFSRRQVAMAAGISPSRVQEICMAANAESGDRRRSA